MVKHEKLSGKEDKTTRRMIISGTSAAEKGNAQNALIKTRMEGRAAAKRRRAARRALARRGGDHQQYHQSDYYHLLLWALCGCMGRRKIRAKTLSRALRDAQRAP